jgi:hypothetical protein
VARGANDAVASRHRRNLAPGGQAGGVYVTPAEARFELDRALVALADANGVPLVSDVRFFPYPDPSRRTVLACAERADGGADIQVLFEMPAPVGDHLDENAVREMFSMCLPAPGIRQGRC